MRGPQLVGSLSWPQITQGGVLVFCVGFQTIQVPGSISLPARKYLGLKKIFKCIKIGVFCSTGNESCIISIFVDPVAWARCVVDPKCIYPFCSLYYNLHFCQKQFTINPPAAKVIFQTQTVQMRIKCILGDVLIYEPLARLNFCYIVYTFKIPVCLS